MLLDMRSKCFKIVNRKVQGVPQSQTTVNPQHQEEEKMTKNNTYKSNKQTLHEKHKDQLPLPQLRWSQC